MTQRLVQSQPEKRWNMKQIHVPLIQKAESKFYFNSKNRLSYSLETKYIHQYQFLT